MNAITAKNRNRVWRRLSLAQRSISGASGALGEGNQHVRDLMMEAQRALTACVQELWEIPVTNAPVPRGGLDSGEHMQRGEP